MKDFSFDDKILTKQIEELLRQQLEEREKMLVDIIENYDFLVGSMECEYKLMEVLPKEANIICSPYIASPTTIYAIKKFDITDLLEEPDKDKMEE